MAIFLQIALISILRSEHRRHSWGKSGCMQHSNRECFSSSQQNPVQKSDDTFTIVASRCGSRFLRPRYSPAPALPQTAAHTLFASETSDHREAAIWTTSFFLFVRLEHERSGQALIERESGRPGEWSAQKLALNGFLPHLRIDSLKRLLLTGWY